MSKYIDALVKQIGATAKPYNQFEYPDEPPICSTGSVAVDTAIGIGGLPGGKVIMVAGPWSSGKTTLMLQSIADFQLTESQKPEEDRRVAALIDAEVFDAPYAESLGVDLDELFYCRPLNPDGVLTMEACIAAMWDLISSGKVGLVVLDSVAAAPTEQEVTSEIGAANIASKARLLSSQLPALVGACNQNNCALVLLNQQRVKPGVLYGSPNYFPGGEALQHACHVIIEVRGSARNDKDVTVNGKVVKNKVGKPYQKFSFVIEFGTGIDNVTGIIEQATHHGLITKKGSWYYKAGTEEQLGQGKAGVRDWLIQDDQANLKRLQAAIQKKENQ